MSEHTPGPWNRDAIYTILRHVNKHPMATGLDDLDIPDDSNWPGKEDVNLVTAAPDLLEALEGIIELHEGEDISGWIPEFQAVERAIAKAKGEA